MNHIYGKQAVIHCEKLHENIVHIKEALPEKTDIIAVVKGDAYGHGLKQMAEKISEEKDVAMLAVSSFQEALTISHTGKKILILYTVLTDNIRLFSKQDNIRKIVQDQIIFTISTFDEIKQFSELAEEIGVKIQVHMRLDFQGGVRGFTEAEYQQAFELLYQNEWLLLKGIYTHVYEAYAEDEVVTKQVMTKYASCFEALLAEHRCKLMIHMLTSVSYVKYREFCYDAVRIGAAIYGLPVEKAELMSMPRTIAARTRCILTISANIVKIIEIDCNASIDYRGKKKEKNRKIGLLPIGCWDIPHFFRGESCKVWLRGMITNVIGEPCMDTCCIDLTDIDEVMVGDEVFFLNDQEGVSLPEKLRENGYGLDDCQSLYAGMGRLPKLYEKVEEYGK